MTTDPNSHDQDAEPPTPDGEEPRRTGFGSDDPTPGSHPDPAPGDDEHGRLED